MCPGAAKPSNTSAQSGDKTGQVNPELGAGGRAFLAQPDMPGNGMPVEEEEGEEEGEQED